MQHHDDHPHARHSAPQGRAARRHARRRWSTRTVGTAVAGTVAVTAITGALCWPQSDDHAKTVASEAAAPTGHVLDTAADPAAPLASPSPTHSATPSKAAAKPKPSPSAPTSHPAQKHSTPTTTTGHTDSGSSRTSPASQPASAVTGTAAQYVQQVIALANTERAKAGCSPLKADSRLNSSAQEHADDMAARNYYEHDTPEGKNAGDRMTAAGYDWHKWGENIHRSPKSPEAAMHDWMNSPGHRANILDCGFKDIGVGVNLSDNGPWWVQNFGS
ncbi:CAP domain-containing protein [Streptomyces sp. NPDC020719]|uniref:CAP domain-containing protein n=1 Tax=unclassified Streptomyces TaxID=2593676 RepID=UPI0033D721BD